MDKNDNSFPRHPRGTLRGDDLGDDPPYTQRPAGRPDARRPRGTMWDDEADGLPPAPSGDAGSTSGSRTLADWRDGLLSIGTIPVRSAFDVCLQLAERLDERGRTGDPWPALGPDSVLVEPDGSRPSGIRVAGLVRGTAAATAPYRAPEVWDGADESARSCQFSLACILYELLVGHTPFELAGAGAAAPVFHAVPALPGSLRAAQGRMLLRALSKDPRARLSGTPSSAMRAIRDARSRRPLVAALAALAVCALAAWGAKEFLGRRRGGGGVSDAPAPVSQRQLLEERAERGDIEAMVELARIAAEGSDETESLKWTEKAARGGHVPSMVSFGRALLAQKVPGRDARDAVAWFEKAAEAGDAEGRASFAECLWEGRGVAQNRPEAFRWARLAADEEIAIAQRIAGLCHRDGIGTDPDPIRAARLLKGAAEKDDAEAQFAWSQILAKGSGVPRNVAEAVVWAEKAAGRGLPEAMVFIGECHAGGAIGGAPDQAESMRWYRMAAEKGHAAAQSLLGNHLLLGVGCEKNPAEGVKWLEKAAAQGYGLAFSNLARCYAEGWGVPKDGAKATDYLKRGAELGDPQSMGEYGAGLVQGRFVRKDPVEGVRWMTKAAETGEGELQFALAVVLLNGLAGKADEKAGLEWLEKAAAGGYPMAQSQLAVFLRKGRFGDPDPDRAFDLELAAARAGVVVSQSRIATCYYNDRDYDEAFRWYKIAAEGGDEDAMIGVANCYDKGFGTEVDKKESLRWYKKASQSSVESIANVARRAVARLSADGATDASEKAEALRLFRRQAEAGDVFAMCDLAQRLDAGNGVPKDPAEAATWWRRIAEIPGLRKDVGAFQIMSWAEYGLHLLDGVGVARNPSEAVRWLRKACEDTDEIIEMSLVDTKLKLKSLACRRLAECYDKGVGVSRNAREAFQWYHAGAINGDVESCLETGDRYADGRAGHLDPMGCERWYEKAAGLGSPEGAYRAGLSYGRKGSLYRSKAEQWLRKAKEMGHAKADAALADLAAGRLSGGAKAPSGQSNGTLTPAEAHNRGYAASQRPGGAAEAFKWYRQAAEQGYGPSCANLGRLYYLGEGVRQDYAEAAKWYRKGADAGVAVAQHGLAVCYLNGRGVAKNATEAVKWFRKAADQGYALAQHSLGACYINGEGVRKDAAEAVKWFRKAAAQGNAASKDALRQLGIR